MQTFMTSLLLNFEFNIPDGAKRIRRDRAGLMTPMVEGELHLGTQLPLKVSIIAN